MTGIKFLFFPENSLTEEKNPTTFDCHYLLPLIQSERRACVAQTHGTIKWESVKEFLHLSTNLFPNNKAAFQLNLWLVSFLDITLMIVALSYWICFHHVWRWMFLLLFTSFTVITENKKLIRFSSDMVHVDTWRTWFCLFCPNNHYNCLCKLQIWQRKGWKATQDIKKQRLFRFGKNTMY